MKYCMIIGMIVFGFNSLAAMNSNVHMRTRNVEALKITIASKLEETKNLIKVYKEMSTQQRAQAADQFLSSIGDNIQFLEKESQALGVSQEALQKDLRAEIRLLKENLYGKPSSSQEEKKYGNENETRPLDSNGGQARRPKPHKSFCDRLQQCFGRRDVQCAGSLATGLLIGKRWGKR
jgi:hypothetical protein